MITTRDNARRIIRVHYGSTFKFRFTTQCSIGVRPVHETQLGLLTLAWRSLTTGSDSAVRIGRMQPGNTIDWDWSNGSES